MLVAALISLWVTGVIALLIWVEVNACDAIFWPLIVILIIAIILTDAFATRRGDDL